MICGWPSANKVAAGLRVRKEGLIGQSTRIRSIDAVWQGGGMQAEVRRLDRAIRRDS
jgi:hypothetical protein